MDFGKVFISSILNTSIEDLRQERSAVREVVDSFGFLKPWAFESAPASSENLDQSYLRHVEECDAFILILGSKVTPPVNLEWLRAKKLKKPILAFVKSLSSRDPEVDDVLDALNKKYAPFKTSDELKQASRLALEQTLIIGIRSLSSKASTLSIKESLQELIENGGRVRVSPLVPVGVSNIFSLQSINVDLAILKKTTDQTVEIPISRIMEVLPAANDDLAVLTISGRLQWMSLPRRWKFLPESLSGDESLGLGKVSSPDTIPQILTILERERIQYCWDWKSSLSDRIGAGWEVFYDDDGRYLRYVVNPSEQIFMIKR